MAETSDQLASDTAMQASNSSTSVQPSRETNPDIAANGDDTTITLPGDSCDDASLLSSPMSKENRQHATWDSSDDDTEAEYSLEYTDDQKQAMMELGSMKLDLGYTEEDPPEYDVSERVRQLNQELANDPLPDKDDRERSIKFKDNLVDLVAPPYDYSDDDGDDAGVKSVKTGEKTDQEVDQQTDQQVVVNKDHQVDQQTNKQEDQPTDHESDNPAGKKQERTNEGAAAEERVLVERAGRFELLPIEDLSADEKRLYGIHNGSVSPSSDGAGGDSVSPQASDETSDTPSKPTDHGNHRSMNHGGNRAMDHANRRPQSASSLPQFTYVSPYALSNADKRRLARQSAAEENSRKEAERIAAEKQQEKRQESSEAFQAWLRQKREAIAEQRQQTTLNKRKAREQEEQNKAEKNGSQFKAWLNAKNRQQREQAAMLERERREYNEGWYIRPRSACDTAFKDWLKKKNEESLRTKQEEKPIHRKGRLLMRRSAKTQALLRAARQIQAFRYVDYYGYRY